MAVEQGAAAAVGAGSWIFGMPFLTTHYQYLDLPLVGKVPASTAMLFDLGVFSLVVGAIVLMLIAVDVMGFIGKGAQRWLDLGVVRFQPSEIAKIAVPLMVARFINRDVCPPSLKNTAIALVLI